MRELENVGLQEIKEYLQKVFDETACVDPQGQPYDSPAAGIRLALVQYLYIQWIVSPSYTALPKYRLLDINPMEAGDRKQEIENHNVEEMFHALDTLSDQQIRNIHSVFNKISPRIFLG